MMLLRQKPKKTKEKVMKKRIFSAFLACILIICSLSVFVSCSSEPTNIEGLKERFVYLIEESKELNVIFLVTVFRFTEATGF